jgi:hypothetical protein
MKNPQNYSKINIESIKNSINFSLFLEPREILNWKERRKDLFNRYFKWRVLSHDLDHIHYYSIMTEDYDFERKAWFALCFGMTYRTPQAFAYSETFDHPNNFTLQQVEEWHKVNWKKTSYGTDARYNKGHFVKQFESVQKWLNGKSFKEKFDEILIHHNSTDNFYALNTEINSLYKFGRMASWITLQCLHDICHLGIDPQQIFIENFHPNSDSSLGSIWNGMCAYENRSERMIGKYGNYHITDEDLIEARINIMQYTNEAEKFSGFKIDSFRKESIWCQYKRLFNENTSKEYPGHSSGDAVSRYLYFRDNWQEIDWTKFRKALKTQPGNVCGLTYESSLNSLFGETGILTFLDEASKDMESHLDLIDINSLRVSQIWEDDNEEVPITFDFEEMLKKTPKYYINI